MHFRLVMAAREIKVLPSIPLPLLWTEIFQILHDALRKIDTYNNDNFCGEMCVLKLNSMLCTVRERPGQLLWRIGPSW